MHWRWIAAAYALGGFEGRARVPQDRAWLEQLFCSDDPEALSQSPRIVPRDEEHGIPLEQISRADAERLLRLLPAPASLEDHHFRDVLKRFAPRWPELVVNLAKTRPERGLQQPELLSLPPWHQHHPSDPLDLLLATTAMDRTSSDWLVAGLAAVMLRPLRPRAFGEPCPQGVALAAEAQQWHDRLPAVHPVRRLYAKIRDQAHAAIASAEDADSALVEG